MAEQKPIEQDFSYLEELLVSAKLLDGHLQGVKKQLGFLLKELTILCDHDRISNEEDDRDRNLEEDLPW